MNGKLASAFISINPIDTDQQSLLVKKWTQWPTWLCRRVLVRQLFFYPIERIPIKEKNFLCHDYGLWGGSLNFIILRYYWQRIQASSPCTAKKINRFESLFDDFDFPVECHFIVSRINYAFRHENVFFRAAGPYHQAPPSTDDHTIPPAFGFYTPTWPGHYPAQLASQQRRRVAWQPNNWDGALLKFNNRIRQYNNLTHGHTILIYEKWI